ncbi:TolC family protein [Sphingomonas daechungensis]|uniref:TolC family protein n=1 Tax=Sphingomonas daechungensis TaxID=1176646 RepID=UPI0037830E2C
MHRLVAAAPAVAMLAGLGSAAQSQSSTPATPIVGSLVLKEAVSPSSPSAESFGQPARTDPVPKRVSLVQAIDEAYARSPAVIAAQAEVTAAEARARQAGYRQNPELSVEVENFGGTGELKGLRSTETTVSLNQRLDLSGRRSARVAAARADIELQKLKLSVARADLASSVRQEFARAVAARERLELANENVDLTKELARIAGLLVDAGREPPLRAMRARSALAQAQAQQEAARADELAARTTLASLLGSTIPIEEAIHGPLDLSPSPIKLDRSLEVRVAAAEVAAAQAALQVQQAEGRFDPAVGAGVRHIRETGDVGLVAGLSVPLKIFDQNRGNIDAARAAVLAAEARQRTSLLGVTSRGRNAISAVQAAQRRLAALQKSALPEAREALRLAQRSWTEGRATLVELLDAQNAYLSTQAALTEAELALAVATAELGRIAAQ